jgi:hypothetical protein
VRIGTAAVTSLVAAVAVALSGCTGDKGLADGAPAPTAPSVPLSSPTPTPTPSPSPSPVAPADPNAKFANDPAVKAWFAYIKARVTALNRRNLRYGPLVRLTTDHRRRAERETLAMMKRDNLVLRGGGYIVVQRATPTGDGQVLLRICEDDDEVAFVNKATGKPGIPVRNRWLTYEARMVRQGGAWKVHDVVEAKFKCKGELQP